MMTFKKYIYDNSKVVMMKMSLEERTTTGIHRLDEVLKGGIPIPSVVLIIGDIGTGKSVMCQQFIYKQASNGFKCVYFCVDHMPDDVKENMLSLGWDVNKLESKGVLKFVDAFIGKGESFKDLLYKIEKEINKHERFVIDSISSIAFIHGERRAYDLLQRIRRWSRDTQSVGIVNAVRGMHSKPFEVAIQQTCCNVILVEMRYDGRYMKVIKTTRTAHTTEEFGIEIEKGGINLI